MMSDLGVSGASAGDDPIELIEAERAVAAAGFDDDAELVDGRAVCPACGTRNDLGDVDSGRAARDTPTGRDDLEVLAFRCGNCGASLRTLVDHDGEEMDPRRPHGDRGPEEPGGPATSTSDSRGASTPGGFPEVGSLDRPVSHASFADEVDRFEHAEPGSLRDQRDLIDAEGDDIRMYTGEPVETEAGWVLPVQQNFAGRDNIAGGGEWPDPHAPPAQPRPADDEPDGTRSGGKSS